MREVKLENEGTKCTEMACGSAITSLEEAEEKGERRERERESIDLERRHVLFSFVLFCSVLFAHGCNSNVESCP